jgi:hypothetical protein
MDGQRGKQEALESVVSGGFQLEADSQTGISISKALTKSILLRSFQKRVPKLHDEN